MVKITLVTKVNEAAFNRDQRTAEDGLDLAKKIILEADKYLTDDGVLIVEVGNSQYALMDMCPDIPFTWLSFAEGGDGVFLLTYAELVKYKEHFKQYFSV